MATINRWSPFDEALSLRDAMNRLFEDSFVAPAGATARSGGLGVEVNIFEQSEGYIVEATVPGLKPEDLDITLHEGVLTISGEVREAQPAEGTKVHRPERRSGRCTRSFSLPAAVKADDGRASLWSGILTLRVPKAEEAKPRKISVQGQQGERTLEAGS